MSADFIEEAFMYFYYAGYGCADTKQYILLNEKEVDKIFWPAETNTRHLLAICGS